jgi:hypothetical protein
MNRTTPALALAVLIGFSVQAMADSSPADQNAPADQNTSADQSTQTPAHKQYMKDCMAKAKAANNGTSDKDMRKACRDQLKSTMGNPDQPVTPAH